MQNLSEKMRDCFSQSTMMLLKKVGDISKDMGYKAYLIGGTVRDLFLRKENLDIDIVIEGDAILFGERLARELHGIIISHKRFGTCTVTTPEYIKIDFATARRETYVKPAALPTVEFSSFRDDLSRRDFTVNAMAISLNEGEFGNLIDYFDGMGDIEKKRIKALHDKSFVDDPTRILRGIRLEKRLGFTIEPHTANLIRKSIEQEIYKKVKEPRLRDEIMLVLKEKEPFHIIKRIDEFRALKIIHPYLKLHKDLGGIFTAIDEACGWYNNNSPRKRSVEKWLIYLMALFSDISHDGTMYFCNKFELKRGEKLRVISYNRQSGRILKTLNARRKILPSKIYRLLEPLSHEATLLLMAVSRSDIGKGRIMEFFHKYNGMRTAVKGDDIKALGVKNGAHFARIMEKILYKKLDGIFRTKEEELAYAKKLAKRRL
ncbi:MAG: CCA tRNA nucleotidyltransferase [Candidatus Omnitrophica bacterium]|nr:CCA tRNA nucleotidyltransferase [Candidatus Omnitrophota bacterium]